MNPKTVLVTGASGFIGRLLTQALLSEEFQVRCMVRRTSFPSDGSVEIVQGDLLEPATLPAAMAGVDTAF